jgi:hypothetical protein
VARMSGGAVQVVGLREFQRELRRLEDTELVNGLKDVNHQVAQRVTGWAQARAAGLGPMQSRAAGSLRASRTQARAQVTGGGAKVPFFGGAEFGAGRNLPRSTRRGMVRGWNQFHPWRGSGVDAGYFLFPSIRSHNTEIVTMYGDAIQQLARRAFPD